MRKQKQLTPIGEWLLNRRSALGLNQRELADISGLSDSTIGEISYGDTPFNLDHAERLASAVDATGMPLLGVSAETLLRIAGRLRSNDYHHDQHDIMVITEASASLTEADRSQVLDYVLMLKRRAVGARDDKAGNKESRQKSNR